MFTTSKITSLALSKNSGILSSGIPNNEDISKVRFFSYKFSASGNGILSKACSYKFLKSNLSRTIIGVDNILIFLKKFSSSTSWIIIYLIFGLNFAIDKISFVNSIQSFLYFLQFSSVLNILSHLLLELNKA